MTDEEFDRYNTLILKHDLRAGTHFLPSDSLILKALRLRDELIGILHRDRRTTKEET